MATYKVALNAAQTIIHVALNATTLPTGFTSVGTYDHDEADDPLGAEPDSHVMINHVRELLGRRSKANPANPALFPDNITDLASFDVYQTETAKPFRITAPAISGTAQVGQTLTCSAGTWSGPASPTLARQWKANGVAIAGATAATYTVQAGDVGKTITCDVTASNVYGTGDTYTTAATAAVIAA